MKYTNMTKFVILMIFAALLLVSCGSKEKITEELSEESIDVSFELSTGEYQKAILLLQTKVESGKASPKEVIDYATAIIAKSKSKDKEKLNKANSLLKELVDKKEYVSEAYRLQGNIAKKLGNLEEAKKLYIKSFDIKRDNKNTLIALGELEKTLGNIDNSLGYLHQAKKYGEVDDILALQLGESYYIKGDDDSLKAARKYFESIIRTSKNKTVVTQAAHNLGMVYFKAGEYDTAQEFLEQALKFNNKHYLSQLNIGRTFLEKFKLEIENGETDLNTVNARAAIGELTKSIQLNENATMGYVYLGDIYQILGNKEYKTYYKKALELLDNDTTLNKLDKENIKNILKNNI